MNKTGVLIGENDKFTKLRKHFFFWRVSLKIFLELFFSKALTKVFGMGLGLYAHFGGCVYYLSKSRSYSVPANETMFRNGWCAHGSQVGTGGYQLFRSDVHVNVGILPNSVISFSLYISPLSKGDVCIYFHLLEALYKTHLFPKVTHIFSHYSTQNEVRLLNE